MPRKRLAYIRLNNTGPCTPQLGPLRVCERSRKHEALCGRTAMAVTDFLKAPSSILVALHFPNRPSSYTVYTWGPRCISYVCTDPLGLCMKIARFRASMLSSLLQYFENQDTDGPANGSAQGSSSPSPSTRVLTVPAWAALILAPILLNLRLLARSLGGADI